MPPGKTCATVQTSIHASLILHDMQNTRVLVVEDDLAICTLVEALLRRGGYECDIVFDGNEAIRLLRSRPYFAILLDLMLPGSFGFEVIRFLHAERPFMASRVVVMTAASNATLRDFDTSMVRAVMRKPFDIQELVDHVDACAALDEPSIAPAPSLASI
jgi:DNA-binding response OmpR family regulator